MPDAKLGLSLPDLLHGPVWENCFWSEEEILYFQFTTRLPQDIRYFSLRCHVRLRPTLSGQSKLLKSMSDFEKCFLRIGLGNECKTVAIRERLAESTRSI
jgi:hypothetical protein